MNELPDWFDLEAEKTRGTEFTALEQFVYDQEPAGKHAKQFREQLLNVINEKAKETKYGFNQHDRLL